ncbi:TlpA family protein disulfide reductase [Planosporangium sp. 12N6]|uniref:TlpA family protein disulfide reductase n=1 Tax=Planosporangium spinosum TaxID=3402278 RepID=UPI003CF4AC49
MSRLRGAIVALVTAAVVLAGCTSTGGSAGSGGARTGAAPAPSGPSCVPAQTPTQTQTQTPTPTGGSASPVAAADPLRSAGTPATGAGEPLPDLALPCFVGGQPVRLAHLGTPAVINLWASWCAPCRTELPQLQRYADRAAGRVQVIGVITTDVDRRGAQSLIDDLTLRFPMLYDERGDLWNRIGPPRVMPTTLLVDAQGRVVYREATRTLDEAALAALVRDHLGVAV